MGQAVKVKQKLALATTFLSQIYDQVQFQEILSLATEPSLFDRYFWNYIP